MKITEELIVTEMSLEGHKLKIPKGFSELLNRSGAWEYIKPDDSKKENGNLKDYDRKVVLEDGRLRTYLTYKNDSVKTKKKIS